MTEIIKKGKGPLRPRARLIKTIGEELISSDTVAIIELVRNCYDADAKKVEILFIGPLVEGSGQIVVKDDGCGMTLDTVRSGWMEPATVIKRITKKTGSGRRILGEKGIGRFASAKLSKKLEMVTKVKNDNEIYASFDWVAFSNEKKYLDEIDCEWEVRAPHLIDGQGTTLTLTGLNTNWDKEKLRLLRTSLSRLVSPFGVIKNFQITLTLPEEFKELSGVIEPPDSLGKPDYSIKGAVSARGKLKCTYEQRKDGKKSSVTKKIDIKQLSEKSRIPHCGPFKFEFRVWDREAANLKGLALEIGEAVKDIRRDLDEAAGISVYRDKFRVLPYGEPKNDWLRLDLRRVQSPTMRVSNNQVIGYVAISLARNKELLDQSNREGIVESSAFDDLKKCIISILNELEQKRYNSRPREEKKTETVEGIFSKISMAPIVAMVEVKLPRDEEAKKIVSDTDIAIKEGVKEAQEVLSRYRRLSTLGLLLDVVLHDGNGIVARLDNDLRILEKEFSKETVSHEKIISLINSIKLERQTMAQLFKRLEPFGGRRKGRPKKIILEDSIKNVFALFHNKLESLNVEINLPQSNTEVKFDEGELNLIFVNLIENSIYWLDTPDQNNRKIAVKVSKRNDDELVIVFSDNGPGVSQDISEKIFEPYFSTRPDGIGLGLTIIGELVTEYDGTFELIKNGPLDGASFRLLFRKRF